MITQIQIVTGKASMHNEKQVINQNKSKMVVKNQKSIRRIYYEKQYEITKYRKQ
jgi:hypothetical protein